MEKNDILNSDFDVRRNAAGNPNTRDLSSPGTPLPNASG